MDEAAGAGGSSEGGGGAGPAWTGNLPPVVGEEGRRVGAP